MNFQRSRGLLFWNSRFLLGCLAATLIIVLLLAFSPISNSNNDDCNCETTQIPSFIKNSKHNLAVLVPFRDRFDELIDFVPHLHKFLNRQLIKHHIFILNQVDKYRFNRASLINAGFTEVQEEYDYVAMHDVDLLPINTELSYAFPKKGPFHVASPDLHPRYHYPTFVGGILLITIDHFEMVNGMSNKYWGWGLEDDEFFVRLHDANLQIHRPENITTGTSNTFWHNHDRNKRKRDMTKCFNQQEITRKRDRITGLHDIKYTINTKHDMIIDKCPFTVFNIELECDKNLTPWCECDDGKNKKKKNV